MRRQKNGIHSKPHKAPTQLQTQSRTPFQKESPSPILPVSRSTEEELRKIEDELVTNGNFDQRKILYMKLFRLCRMDLTSKNHHYFLIYSLLNDIKALKNRHERILLANLLKKAISAFPPKGDFRLSFIELLYLIYEVETDQEIRIAILEILKAAIDLGSFEIDLKYSLIELLYSGLFSKSYNIKKHSLSILFSLTKRYEDEFLIIFEKTLDKCLRQADDNLTNIFLECMAELDLIVYSDRLSDLISKILSNPTFSNTKEKLLNLLKFVENCVTSTPCISSSLSRALFLFACSNMRHLEPSVRKRSVDVFCIMDLTQINEDVLMMCLQREKFQDYQKKKLKLRKLPMGIENRTEKIITQLEIKSLHENSVVGSIHHVLEDELPEIRSVSIKALETLGKIFQLGKTKYIKELLLYFLNDDFDKVRIRALQALDFLFKEINLSNYELDTIQFNLKENIYELRVSIYKLLFNLAPKSAKQVSTMLVRLIENLKLYREDALWIYKAIKKIFEKNKRFQVDVLNQLLFDEQAHLIQEMDTRDPEAVVRIILLSNALKSNFPLLERYPHYYKKHVILMKEVYPDLIYDLDNDDVNHLSHLKNSILGQELIEKLLKSLNDQLKGKKNKFIERSLNRYEGAESSNPQSRMLKMFKFTDRLINIVKEQKTEISNIVPNKNQISDLIFEIFLIKSQFELSSKLVQLFNACEGFLWVQFLYAKIKIGQTKLKINPQRLIKILIAVYEASLALSKNDQSGQLAKLSKTIQPLLSNTSHTFFLTNKKILNLLLSFTKDFSLKEFIFEAEDFTVKESKKVFVHPKESETEIIEVLPRYPFKFCIYIESDKNVKKNLILDNRRRLYKHQRVQ